jgi:hypothetical protein
MTETKSLAEAVAMLQTRLPEIKKSQTAEVKTKTGADYSYTYADLAQVTRELMPILGGLGLSFIAKPTLGGDGKLVLAYKLLHVSGESEEGEYPLSASGSPQAMGGAITYARRYCLCAVTGIAPEDDDDGAAAQAEALGQRGTAARSSQPRQKPQQADSQQAARRAPASTPPPLPAEAGNAVTQPQLKMMHALFGKVDWTDRADMLRAASAFAGRELSSSKDLTRDEASKVIDALQQIADGPDPAMRLTELVGATAQPYEPGPGE